MITHQDKKKTVLELNQVSKFYGSVPALQQIDLKVGPGQIVALLGCNGAGKTSLVNLAAGLSEPSAGVVQIFGQHPNSSYAKFHRRILPQELSFPKQLRVREVLKVVSAHYPPSDYESVAEEIGLSPLFDRPSSALSGGERRKLALLCSLAGHPELVLMDEPTANVDLVGQEAIRRVIRRYFKNRQSSMVFSSHHMAEVEDLADRVVVMSQGRIVFDGNVDQIRSFFGEKKVLFRPSVVRSNWTLPGVTKVIQEEHLVELHGASSDDLLKGVLQVDPAASHFRIELPTLEEAILKIWQSHSKRESQ